VWLTATVSRRKDAGIRTRTYANVMVTVLLFIVLVDGRALAKNSVGTKQLKNGAVTKKKIAKSAQQNSRPHSADDDPPAGPNPEGEVSS
jgi:hypothetical protein